MTRCVGAFGGSYLKNSNDSSICAHLLELIDKQEGTIVKQNEIIAKLTNESFEQENLISVLMRECAD